MEQTRCYAPGCDAIIGGQNHVSAKGNSRIEDPTRALPPAESVKGYVSKLAASLDEIQRYQRISPGLVLTLRLCMHLLFEAACAIAPQGVGLEVALLMDMRDSRQAALALRTRVTNEFEMLAQPLALRGSRLVVGTLILLDAAHLQGITAMYDTVNKRNLAENKYAVTLEPVLTKLRERVERAMDVCCLLMMVVVARMNNKLTLVVLGSGHFNSRTQQGIAG